MSPPTYRRSLVSVQGIIVLSLVAIALPIVALQRLAATSKPTSPTATKLPTAAQGKTSAVVPNPRPSTQPVRVVAMGRIEPVSGVIQVGAPINEILGQLLVQEGDWIKEGQIVAYLQSYEARKAELAKAKQDLELAQSRLVADTEYSQAQVRERTVESIKAPVAQEGAIAAQQAQIDALHSEQNLAMKELERYRFLVQQGAVAQGELDERQSQVEQLTQRIRQAEQTLQQLIDSRDREVALLEAQVVTARSNTSRIQANSEVTAAQRSIELAEAQLENTIIRAPCNCRVLRVITKPGEGIGDDGKGKGTLLAVADNSAMQVIAEVNESDIRRVRPGQATTIISRNKAFEGTLKGQVTEVGLQIFKNNVLNDDPSALSDARVVEVKVDLEDDNAVAKFTNLQVDVHILISPASQTPGS